MTGVGSLPRGYRVGRYEVLTQLTVGGMSELFLAFVSARGGFRKFVVLKRIPQESQGDEHLLNMFLDEARISAAFSHPNICHAFDLSEEKGALYFALEFIAGQNLNQIMRACARKRHVLPIGFTVSVVRDVCLALHYAHTFTEPAGRPSPVIHRDVAHKNVMVAYDGATKLLDFGIAKMRHGLSQTQVGSVKGTAGYMSPEQVRGETIDARSDIFSTGVMLHELVTGQRLFSGRNEVEEMAKILNHRIPRPRELYSLIPEQLSEAVMRALERNPVERYATARDMAKSLEQACGSMLFDTEQRAVFMRELFEDKMRATRSLLEQAERAAIAELSTVVESLHDDRGDVFPEQEYSSVARATELGAAELLRRRSEEQADMDLLQAQLHADVRAAQEERRPHTWMLIFFVGLFVAGLLVYKAWTRAQEEQAKEKAKEARVPPGFVSALGGMKPPDLPQYGAPKPQPQPTTMPDEEPTAAGTSPSPRVEADPKRAPAAAEPRPAGKEGSLTLVVFPESIVHLGKQSLGVTPLFNVRLPVGTHRLTVRGDDGVKRELSVPITAGKNTAFKLKLEDIPLKAK